MPYNYISQADVQNYMGQALTTNGISSFTMMLQPMQDMIDWYCNRSWNFTNPITETFNGLKDNSTMTLEDTFFPKYKISESINDSNYPQAKGIIGIKTGLVNGVGSLIDLTYVYSYGTHVKVWAWNYMTNMFNPLGLKGVQIEYNSDDAGNAPTPIKLAFAEWMARRIQNAPDANKEAVQAFAGQIKVTYKQDASGAMPDFVKMVLDQYRMPPVDHF